MLNVLKTVKTKHNIIDDLVFNISDYLLQISKKLCILESKTVFLSQLYLLKAYSYFKN